MKLTIHPTKATVLANGVPVRIWSGTTESGAICHAFIASVATADTRAAAEIEAAIIDGTLCEAQAVSVPQDFDAGTHTLRDVFLDLLDRHARETGCDLATCPDRVGILAWLAHGVRLSAGELIDFIDQVSKYDSRCKKSKGECCPQEKP